MTTLVTGAGGFLGGYVARHLESEGATVVRAGRPELEIPSTGFEELVARSAPELVVHCATPASVPDSVEDPARDRRGSVEVLEGLVDLLARGGRAARLVFVGSAAVYGQPETLPIAEDHPLAPVSPYGTNRALCEEILRAGRVPSACLRVFSAYGEGLRRQVLWDICSKAVAGAVELAGTGTETRDFVHASDVARAVSAVAAGAAFEGEAYNVGTGTATTISELARTLVSALEVDAPVSFSGRARPGDPDRWQANPERLEALGWRPEIDLFEGASSYARWARSELTRATSASPPTATRSATRRGGDAQAR